MPPKKEGRRELLRFHRHGSLSPASALRSHKNRLCRENPQVVIAPFLRDISSQHKYRFTALPSSASLFKKEEFSDVRIVIGSETYFAHRCILSNASDVFATMLRSDWLKGDSSNTAELNLTEDQECFRVFERFLYFIYSGSVVISESYVIPLFVLADKYNIKSLCDECIKVIENGLKIFRVVQNSNQSNAMATEFQPEVNFPRPPKWESDYIAALDNTESSDSSDDSSEEDESNAMIVSQAPADNVLDSYRAGGSNVLHQSSSSEHVSSGVAVAGKPITRVIKWIPSETFSVASVLRLLNYESLHSAALVNLEARVGNQIAQGNYFGLWKDLESHVVIEILSDQKFNSVPEFQLFVAAKRWIEAKPERMQDSSLVKRLLECIRYPMMSIRELYQAEKDGLVIEHAQHLIVNALRFKLYRDRLHSSDIERENWIGDQFTERDFEQPLNTE